MESMTLEQIQAQIADLKKREAEIIAKERDGAIQEIRNLVRKYDVVPDEVFGKGKKVPKAKGKNPPKYQSPDGRTWTGIGKKPSWIAEALERGESLDKFLIK